MSDQELPASADEPASIVEPPASHLGRIAPDVREERPPPALASLAGAFAGFLLLASLFCLLAGAALIALWLVAIVQIVDEPLQNVLNPFVASSTFSPIGPDHRLRWIVERPILEPVVHHRRGRGHDMHELRHGNRLRLQLQRPVRPELTVR